MADSFPRIRDVITEGEAFAPAVYLRHGNGNPILHGDVSFWGLKVYDSQSISEDVAVYVLTHQSPSASTIGGNPIFPDEVVHDGWARSPEGRTFLHVTDPYLLFGAQGGHTYRYEYRVNLSPSTDFGTGVAMILADVAIRPRFSI